MGWVGYGAEPVGCYSRWCAMGSRTHRVRKAGCWQWALHNHGARKEETQQCDSVLSAKVGRLDSSTVPCQKGNREGLSLGLLIN